jgi:hypothetical protein
LAPNSPELPSSGTNPVTWLDKADRPLSFHIVFAHGARLSPSCRV